MASVTIHPPKTPVTTGSSGVAKATLPNVCKLPGPPAPFVPGPLPNIAKSGSSPNGFSTTVNIEGNAVAIRGATFESIGDIASKGTGGGLISANTQGPAKFITPGSLTVKIEGKSVHLLGEPMLNNCGPGGSPPNTGATMSGLKQNDGKEAKPPPPCPDGAHSEVAVYPEVSGDERNADKRIQVGNSVAATTGDKFEMAAAQLNVNDGDVSNGRQISRNRSKRDGKHAKGDDQKVHMVCQICGKKREVDHVQNDGTVVEAKSGDPNDPGQLANNRKLVADGKGVAYKLPHSDVFNRDGIVSQRAQNLMNQGFTVVGVPF